MSWLKLLAFTILWTLASAQDPAGPPASDLGSAPAPAPAADASAAAPAPAPAADASAAAPAPAPAPAPAQAQSQGGQYNQQAQLPASQYQPKPRQTYGQQPPQYRPQQTYSQPRYFQQYQQTQPQNPITCEVDTRCWQYSVECTLADAFPFERRSNKSCEECLDMCRQTTVSNKPPLICKSVVYDAVYRACDLFACNAPRLTKYPGRAYFQLVGQCNASSSTIAPTAAPNTPDSCPAGQTAIMISVQNSQVSINGQDARKKLKKRAASSAAECAQACLDNKLANGQPINCKSAQFSSGKCQLSTDEPKAPADVQAGEGTYFKKLCFPDDLVSGCDKVWEELPQTLLVGYNALTVDAPTYDACLTECRNAQKNHQFTCNSGMYFYELQEKNCILNIETQETQPALVLQTDSDKVVYYEPKCAGGGGGRRLFDLRDQRTLKDTPSHVSGQWSQWGQWAQWAQWAQWGQWSECKGTWLTRTRSRQCGAANPASCEKQEESCDPRLRGNSVDNSKPDSEALLINGNEIRRKDAPSIKKRH